MSVAVDQSLQDALREFQAALSPDQHNQLEAIKAVPDAAAVIAFTAQLDEQNARRRTCGVASRLCTFLQSVQQFSSVVETFVSSHPTIAALVWGSVKLTMLVALNFVSYFDKLSTLFMSFNKLCPRFEQYQILYPDSSRLQSALCNFHAAIIRCCRQALQVIQRPRSSQIINALWRSFQAEFEPFEADVRRCSDEVKDEISLAKAQADHQDQQLQLVERDAASKGRKSLQSFITKTSKQYKESKEWRVQRDERNSRKRRKHLLDSLSTYNYFAAFKQARKKRHGTTAQWLTQTSKFGQWMNGAGSSVFWCSGKRSGKTVVTANVIDHLFLNKPSGDVCIGFFLCRFDEAVSLKSETILRSIIRQSLEATNLTRDIETCLEEIAQNALSGINELRNLLQKRIAVSRTYHIIIDGLDECEKSERNVILDVLRSVIASNPSDVKIFLASRDSVRGEIKKRFPSLQHVSMSSSKAQSDITTYIREAINGKLSNGDLVLGSDVLVEEIQKALIGGAQGMFLWVTFQIEDICSQCSDEDIRQALRNLPKDLTETFNRALSRILANGKAKIARQVFRWVAAAKRPLSLEELREAIAIEPGQPYSKPERLVNDMSRITAWCENLIVVDEEDEAIQFAHHTVKQYFLGDTPNRRFDEFQFQLTDADHEVGEVCVTYLNFNDFKTQLIRRPKPAPSITLSAIVGTALLQGSNSTTVAPLLRSVIKGRFRKTGTIDAAQKLASYNGSSSESSLGKFLLEHPFLGYASQNWLLHTSNFGKGKSKTWNLWTRLLLDEQSLGLTPWTHEQFVERDREVGQWICDEHHYALLRFIGRSDRTFSEDDRIYFVKHLSKKKDLALLEIFLETDNLSVSETAAAFEVAATGGHLQLLERLLATKPDVNSPVNNRGKTALHLAAEEGHLEVVERLLAANADVHAATSIGWIALHSAARAGHLGVVERLLAANADVHAVTSDSWTALHLAAEKGHLEVVERLLAANADVHADRLGDTALRLAADGRHQKIVALLKAAGASR